MTLIYTPAEALDARTRNVLHLGPDLHTVSQQRLNHEACRLLGAVKVPASGFPPRSATAVAIGPGMSGESWSAVNGSYGVACDDVRLRAIGVGGRRARLANVMPQRPRRGGGVVEGRGSAPRAMRAVMDEMHHKTRQEGNIRQRRKGMHAMIAQDDAEQNGAEQVGGAAQSPVHITSVAHVAEDWLKGC